MPAKDKINSVMPAKAGIQNVLVSPDASLRWHDGFSFTTDDVSIIVTNDTNKSSLEIIYGALGNNPGPSAKDLKQLVKIPMLHNWYLFPQKIHENKQTVKVVYCHELRIFHTETIDSEFPEYEFKECDALAMLSPAPYYKEMLFDHFLKKRGVSIEILRFMPGMSQNKLELMFHHEGVINALLNRGMTFVDFANADEKKFEEVIKQSDQADYSLAKLETLFGLSVRLERRAGLLDSSAVNTDVPISNKRMTCQIL